MTDMITSILYGAVLLIYGTLITASFSGLRPSKQNFLIFFGFCAFSGALQLTATFLFSMSAVWKIYPLITHLPLVLLLVIGYRKPITTALVATFTAYMFCQPAKWISALVFYFTKSDIAESLSHVLSLALFAFVSLQYLSNSFSQIFNKDLRSVSIFSIVPTVYYFFDYITAVYTDLWPDTNRILMEFLPFFLTMSFIIFCVVYYKEYEQVTEAKRKEQIFRVEVEQQTKRIATVKQMEQDIRLLRHDMRMFLSSLAVSIENGETDTATKMIDSQIERIEGVQLMRFCNNDILNYVLSDYAGRCKDATIEFSCTVDMGDLPVDEILFASIVSNALDNAVNALLFLPYEKRKIKLMLKDTDGHLLLSVKNPVGEPIRFVDGLPITKKDGRGYGTQSIRYLTEKMGGNCQFSVQNNTFVLRVVL